MIFEDLQQKLLLATSEQSKGNFVLSNSFVEDVISNFEIEISTSIDSIELYVESLLVSARNYRYLGDTAKAIYLVSEAKKLSEDHQLTIGLAKSLNILGLLYNSMSEKENAMKYFSHALKIYTETDNKIGIASVSNNIGIIYDSISDYENALKYYTKTLEISEGLQEIHGIAASNLNIGIIYKLLGNTTTALEYYQKAFHSFEVAGNLDGIANVSGNIGNIISDGINKENSLEWFLKALRIYEDNNNQLGIAITSTNIGLYYKSHLQNETALEYYKRALFINEEIHNKKGISTALLNIGIVYLTKESSLFDLISAEMYLKKAEAIALDISNKENLKAIYEQISNLYSEQSQYKLSLEYFKKSVQLDNEIHSEEAITKANQFDQRRKIEEDEKGRLLKLARFQEQERIFHNILPISIANRLIEGEQTIAESFENVSVFFSDIVNFTTLSSKIEPAELVKALNTIFTAFDRIGTKYGLEKIKTIGDAYMAVCGVPEPFDDHSKRTAKFALEANELISTIELHNKFKDVQIRIGLHCGNVVAGIIGEKKFTYDVWGDAVNIASRMESSSEAGRIHISDAFAKSIENYPEFSIIPRGEITIKGKGIMNTYWLEKGN